jgi:TIR domain
VESAKRVALITRSARSLVRMEWADVDLIFSAAGEPLKSDDQRKWAEWDRYDFCISRLRYFDSEHLERLGSIMAAIGDDVPAEPGPWAPGQLKLFMSHLAVHKQLVGQIRDELQKDSVDAFVAHTSVEPSKEWEDVIEAGLRTCDAMVALLHAGFHVSNWCDQEVGFGLARKVPTLPIIIDEMPYGFMSKYQAISGRDLEAHQLASRIRDWLVKVPKLQMIMAELGSSQ